MITACNDYKMNKKFTKKMLNEVMQKIQKRNVRINSSSIEVDHGFIEKFPEKFGGAVGFGPNGKTTIIITIKLRKITGK